MDWATLRQTIDQHFNEEELRTLCFDLGIDYESLGGRGKAANITELVALFQRNGQQKNYWTIWLPFARLLPGKFPKTQT